MSTTRGADEVEHYLQAVVEREPQVAECLVCFVDRMVGEFGCDGSLLWAVRFRDLRSPTATALERRLVAAGIGCDCLVPRRGYRPVRAVMVRDVHTDELERPEPMPPCAGVRRTNTRPCAHWEWG